MKAMKRIFGTVILTAVMAVGAMEVLTPKEVGACYNAENCAMAATNYTGIGCQPAVNGMPPQACCNVYASQCVRFCGSESYCQAL